MRITVYVPCHNNEATLPPVLKALREQSRPADQFLFINDHCTDRSPAIAAEHRFEVHELTPKRGLAAGRNRALELATGDVLVGIDADVVVSGDYLAKLEKHFQANPEIAAIGGRLNERFTETPPDLWRSLHMPQHFGDRPLTNPRLLFGCTMAVRVPVARKIGGWNERFITNNEDADISGRMKSAGLTLLYAPDCLAWHLRRDGLDSVLRSYWNWYYHGSENLFLDMSRWLQTRPQAIWGNYCSLRAAELSMPQLSCVTLLMPWTMLMRDVNALRAAVPDAGNIADVAIAARHVLGRYGFHPQLVGQLAQWLEGLATRIDAEASTRGRLRREICDAIAYGALGCIPDAGYAQLCQRNAATFLEPPAEQPGDQR